MLPELYEKYKHLEDLKVFWGGKSKKITNVREYLERYFKNGTKATWFKDKTLQCSDNRNRSFYDLFFIVKARFKEVTEGELAFNLMDMFSDYKLEYIPCPDVRKVTFFTEKMHDYGININEVNSRYYEFERNRKFDDELSFIEIEELAKNYEKQQNINN